MKVDKEIMSLFYRAIDESVMSYCIISWFGPWHKKANINSQRSIKLLKEWVSIVKT